MANAPVTYNFVVSDYRKLWLEGARRLFILEPYVYHAVQRDGRLPDYDEVLVAPVRHQSGADLQKDNDFVCRKFEQYAAILGERLNRLHGTDYGTAFWRRALSVSFERYIVFLHELFENCERHYDAEKHDCTVLSDTSYYVPVDFEDQRAFFQHSHYGQEQIFSIYMHALYPEGLKTRDDRYEARTEGVPAMPGKGAALKELKQKVSRITLDKVLSRLLIKLYARKRHRIGILGSFFSEKNLNTLMLQSGGAIYPLQWQYGGLGNRAAALSIESRKRLSETGPEFDRFDRFFFASLEHCLPRILVENFREVTSHFAGCFEKDGDLEFVTSEAWLGSDSLSIALALLRERGVRHIFNEHNYLEHPWAGSGIRQRAGLSDVFASLGWHSDRIPNLVKAASLHGFALNRNVQKEHEICYISSIPLVKRPHYTAAYGESAENALKYVDFERSFFASLSSESRRSIVFRQYPKSAAARWLCYDQNALLAPYLDDLKGFDDTSSPSKLLMLRSRLVIIGYISTSYLESMIMNLPTIFFWNPQAYHLNEEHRHFFDALIAAGICQTDPVQAARFVESVKDDPLGWWRQDAVQKAKDEFLRQNVGEPQVMIDYLLGLLQPGQGAALASRREVS